MLVAHQASCLRRQLNVPYPLGAHQLYYYPRSIPFTVFHITVLRSVFNNFFRAPFELRVYEDNRACLTLQAPISYAIKSALFSKLVHGTGIGGASSYFVYVSLFVCSCI